MNIVEISFIRQKPHLRSFEDKLFSTSGFLYGCYETMHLRFLNLPFKGKNLQNWPLRFLKGLLVRKSMKRSLNHSGPFKYFIAPFWI